MDEHKTAADLHADIVQFAKDTIEPYKPEWAERREIAKTLISLSSAALIFTITFSTSITTPSTPRFWRYSLLVCWIAFICSLACSMGSLWFSMSLSSLPILVDEQRDTILEVIKISLRRRDADTGSGNVGAIFGKQLDRVARDDLFVYWLLRIALLCFGIALLILTIVGVRQLLR